MRRLRQVAAMAMTWGTVWLAAALLLGLVIGIFDPDSMDAGDAEGLLLVFGAMGALSGALFGLLVPRSAPAPIAVSYRRALAWGVLATAVVQVAFLNHGNGDLSANIPLAIVFSAFGGIVGVLWQALARFTHAGRSTEGAGRSPA